MGETAMGRIGATGSMILRRFLRQGERIGLIRCRRLAPSPFRPFAVSLLLAASEQVFRLCNGAGARFIGNQTINPFSSESRSDCLPFIATTGEANDRIFRMTRGSDRSEFVVVSGQVDQLAGSV
jgi:hypothetical protein